MATASTAAYATNNPEPAGTFSSASASVYTVQAVSDPSKPVKIKANLIISWDGDECLVLGRDNRYFDEPIRARYSTTYKGYPWVVTIGRQTWYFAN